MLFGLLHYIGDKNENILLDYPDPDRNKLVK
jgi:hypothetical protein